MDRLRALFPLGWRLILPMSASHPLPPAPAALGAFFSPPLFFANEVVDNATADRGPSTRYRHCVAMWRAALTPEELHLGRPLCAAELATARRVELEERKARARDE